MRLDYRILWIDDSPGWVEAKMIEIEEYLRKEGCEPDIKYFETGTDINKHCTETDFDLLIIDYHLPQIKGNLLISEVRKSGIFTEIVFYSKERPSPDSTDVIDGIFFTDRDEATDTIQRVIDLTLHKLNDLGVIRGLMITAAIDLEVKIEEIIISAFGDNGDVFRDKVLGKSWLDFGKKHMLLASILKDRIAKCNDEERRALLGTSSDILKKFATEIVEQRNILAHSRKTIDDGKTILKGINRSSGNIEFDCEWLNEMRENLKKHKENLEEIEKVLVGTK